AVPAQVLDAYGRARLGVVAVPELGDRLPAGPRPVGPPAAEARRARVADGHLGLESALPAVDHGQRGGAAVLPGRRGDGRRLSRRLARLTGRDGHVVGGLRDELAR